MLKPVDVCSQQKNKKIDYNKYITIYHNFYPLYVGEPHTEGKNCDK